MLKSRLPILLILLTALAAAVRGATLAVQSLWLDEVYTVVEAGRPWHTLLLGLLMPQQGYPLYILGMRLWIALFGTSEAALRLPSALAGAGTVPLLYLLGRRTFGRPAGLLAAALLALSPLAIWYSLEAKSYALWILVTVAAWLLLWEAVERGGRWRWVAWAGMAVVALSVHRLSILSLLGQLVYLLYIARQGLFTRRYRLLLLGLLALTLLLTVAGLWFALGREGSGRQFDVQRRWQDVANTWTQFSLRISPGPPEPPMVADRRPWLIPFGIATLAGLAALGQGIAARAAHRRRAVFLLCALVVPIGIFYLLYLIRPFYYERYLLGTLPAYLLLLAVGVTRMGTWTYHLGSRPAFPVSRVTGARSLLTSHASRFTLHSVRCTFYSLRLNELLAGVLATLLGLLALATTLGLFFSSWQQVQDWTLTRLPYKEQYREATRYLQEHLHPGDLVVVHPGYLAPAVEFYGARFPRVPLELETITNTETVDYSYKDFTTTMDRLARGRRRACLLYAPAHAQTQAYSYRVYDWFYHNPFLRQDERHWTGLDLYCISFNTAYRGYMPTPQVALDARFAGKILLWGADLEPFQASLQPGDSLPLTLYLEGLQPNLPDIAVVVRLVDAAGQQVWAESSDQPLNGHLPTWKWEPGDEFLDYAELLLPEDLPPGPYSVEAGFREIGPGEMLPQPDGSFWERLGIVQVGCAGKRPPGARYASPQREPLVPIQMAGPRTGGAP